MGVENVHNGNAVLREFYYNSILLLIKPDIIFNFAEAALNLFINSNAQDLVKEMKPDLKKELMGLLSRFIKNIFEKIPYEAWIE